MNYSLQKALSFIFSVLIAIPVSAAAPEESAPSPLVRNVQFSNLTSADGLSGEFVQAVVQDAAGYIWFGTQDGLNRFDGYEIVIYTHDQDDPTTISNNFIWPLYVDSRYG